MKNELIPQNTNKITLLDEEKNDLIIGYSFAWFYLFKLKSNNEK